MSQNFLNSLIKSASEQASRKRWFSAGRVGREQTGLGPTRVPSVPRQQLFVVCWDGAEHTVDLN